MEKETLYVYNHKGIDPPFRELVGCRVYTIASSLYSKYT